MTEQVISAISTPAGCGGVAIIRLSGGGALAIAEKIFSPAGKQKVMDFKPNYMYAGDILCQGFKDFGFCVYFKAPKSFTGEDVVELHCHGGVQIARGVLKATLKAGARAAERGEFTRRAFVNGKLSLSSAEGMIDMINAESEAEMRAGSLLYREKLSKEVRAAQDELKEILASIAADTDYPEEGIEETELGGLSDSLSKIIGRIDGLAAAYSRGKYIKSGVSVAICGAPNAGKSSLLNALLGYDKAIVSPVAGTTRDTVEGTVEIGGLRYNFYDTAGIRDNADEIESMGIDRTFKAVSSADIVLCLSDEGDFSAADGVEANRLIKVFTKCDKLSPRGDFDAAVSSLTGEGLDGLKQLFASRINLGNAAESEFVIEERHFSALTRAAATLNAARQAIGSFPLDVVSLDIREGWRILGEITGETADEEIIDVVFSRFCVGK